MPLSIKTRDAGGDPKQNQTRSEMEEDGTARRPPGGAAQGQIPDPYLPAAVRIKP
jgi:hypothetical protein